MKAATLITMTLATVLTAGMMLSSANAQAGQCLNHVYAQGSGESAGAVAKFRKRRAERRAKSAWESYIANHYGKRYADIDDAKYMSVSCGLNARGNTRCTVKATPCAD